MKIAAVKKFTQVLVAMAVAAVMAALLCAPKASDPPRKMANAGAGLPPGTALTVPWKPMAAAW